MKKGCFLGVTFFLSACSPATLEELQFEARLEMKRFALDLREIQTRDDALKQKKKLQKHFNQLAELILEVKKFPGSDEKEMSEEATLLFVELARLYEIAGVKEVIEEAESDAIYTLTRAI
jgi:hypothetical protein